MNSFRLYIRQRFFPVILFSVVLLSCSMEKQDPINQLEELTEEIRLHHEEYSVAEWKQSYGRYEQIAADMENYTYTTEELEKIGKLEGECVGYFMKSTINSLDGLGKEVEGFFDGLKEAIQ